MSERKIRLTLSSTLNNGVGALTDIDFDNENLDVDLDVAAVSGVSVLIKEYTVDVAAGTYNLDISFKNDVGDGDGDRNLTIEKIEFANDGVNYGPFLVTSLNTNLEQNKNFSTSGWREIDNPNYNPSIPKSESNHPFTKNPNFNEALPETDGVDSQEFPGSNPWFLYEFFISPVTIYNSSTATFQISFS
jgi:hypothetical protein